MKTRKTTRITAAFLTLVMVFLMVPMWIIPAAAEINTSDATDLSEATNNLDYTPFIIETINGATVYNAQTADLTYDFYMKARSFIDGKIGDFTSIDYNGVSYPIESLLYLPSGTYPTCDMLACIVNFNDRHVLMVAFRGTDFGDWQEVKTDLAFASGKDGYHEGFEEAAQKHFDYLVNYSVRFNLGDSEITFADYMQKMTSDDNYTMIITGHSLGAGVAGVFTSKYIDRYADGAIVKNSVAYTFASPLTASVLRAEADQNYVKNIFNFVNTDDFITEVGADIFDGSRSGTDLKYKVGQYEKLTKGKIKTVLSATLVGGALGGLGGIIVNGTVSAAATGIITDWDDYMNNHHMGTAYIPTKNYVNSHIDQYLDTFVLYNHYDLQSNTYQRVIYNDGKLIVSGSGVLLGDWKHHTLVDFSKVKNNCSSIVFSNCTITEIGDRAFSGLGNRNASPENKLILPATLNSIGAYAFFQCNLFSGVLTLHKNIMYVGDNAFNGCTELTEIYAKDAVDMKWGYGAFANCVGQGQLYLPNNSSSEGVSLGRDVFSKYYVEDAYGIYEIFTDDMTSGNFVLPNDKIYVGRISDELLKEYPFFDFHYYLIEGNDDLVDNIENQVTSEIEGVARIDESGCITILPTAAGKEFTVVFLFDDDGDPVYKVQENWYNLHITVMNEPEYSYSSGIGTAYRPYLISNYGELYNIYANIKYATDNNLESNSGDLADYYLSAHYKLVDDIVCTYQNDVKAFGTNSKIPFSGIFDGNGHSIIDMKGQGLIGFNNGTVKNLTIDHATITSSSAVSGALCGTSFIVGNNCSSGNIINCHVINDSSCNVGFYYSTSAPHHYMGGICGINNGKIYECSVSSASLSATCDAAAAYVDCVAFVGGIAGSSLGTSKIEDCLSAKVKIHACTSHRIYDKAASSKNTITYSHIRIGGVLGALEEKATAKRCISYDVEFTKKSSHSRYDHLTANDYGYCDHVEQTGKGDGGCCYGKFYVHKNSLIAYRSSATDTVIENCYGEDSDKSVLELMSNSLYQVPFEAWSFDGEHPTLKKQNTDVSNFSIKIEKGPHKTHYYIGESLNLYGLVIRDNNDQLVSGYTVSGFDKNKSGDQTITVSYATGYCTIKSVEFVVTVENIVPETIVVKPKLDQYDAGTELTEKDFYATVYYNNGDVETINGDDDENANGLTSNKANTLKFEFILFTDTYINGTKIFNLKYNYTGMSSSGTSEFLGEGTVAVAVKLVCQHKSTVVKDEIDSTYSQYGYTGDSVCLMCNETVHAGIVLPIVSLDENFKIASAYLNLTEDINVVYRASVPAGYENPYMVFVFNEKTYTVTDYFIDSNGRYCFKFAGVNPQCMGDNINATLYATVDGELVSVNKASYSVKDYCSYILSYYSNNAEMVALISDLLNYGEKAQLYRNYKADVLVTNGLALSPSAFALLGAEQNKLNLSGEKSNVADWKSAGLYLVNSMAMNLKFTAADIENLTVEVSINGRKTIFTKEDFESVGSGVYQICFTGIMATEFDDVVTAVIKQNGAQVGRTLEYSVNSYVYYVQSQGDSALLELVKAIYNYGNSAATYAK